jgi:hypothetical protein
VITAAQWRSVPPADVPIAQLVVEATAPITPAFAEFVANTSRVAAPHVKNLPMVSADDVLACSRAWSAGVSRTTANALKTDSSCAQVCHLSCVHPSAPILA